MFNSCNGLQQAACGIAIVQYFTIGVDDIAHTTKTIVFELCTEGVCLVFSWKDDTPYGLRNIAQHIIQEGFTTSTIFSNGNSTGLVIEIEYIVFFVVRVLNLRQTIILIDVLNFLTMRC